MKIQIEVSRPPWARLPRTWRMRLLVALATAAAVAVPAAWASHMFADVPATSPHHDDVAAIFHAGITTGCNPPQSTHYCPEQPVRRDQMASFLHRGLGRVGIETFFGALAPPGNERTVGEITIVPGVAAGSAGTGLVRADAAVSIHVDALSGCPCVLTGNLYLAGRGYMAQRWTVVTVRETGFVTMPLVGVRPAGEGPQTVQVRIGFGAGTIHGFASGNVSAAYFPFGASGGNTFAEPEAGGGASGR